MRKKISTLALAGLLAMPALASAADAQTDMQAKIDAMSRQIEQMKAQMAEIKTSQTQKFEDFEAKSEKWDLASRFQWSGDIRNRVDMHSADTASYYKATTVGTGINNFVTVQPVVAAAAAGAGWANINAMLAALGGALGSPAALQGALGGAGALTTAQATALWSMFTNGEVQTMLGGMGALPTTAITDAMASPQALAGLMKNLSPAARASIFTNMAYTPTAAATYDNDTLYTTRLRLNLRAKATEDVEVKARIVGYKAWGMQDSPTPEQDQDGVHNTNSPYFLNSRSFDGTTGRQPGNNLLILDRAYMNWNNIGGSPVWFSAGRRPTTDGPPAHLRMNNDERMATPVAYMDYPFDGATLGYAYNNLFGIQDAPGRIRFCYGRGFEAGPQQKNTGLSDVDFAGLNWDVYSKGNRFFNIQSFGAFNIFNVPGDTVFPNPLESAQKAAYDANIAAGIAGTSFGASNPTNTYLDRKNMGDIFQTAAVFMDKYQNLNYFLTGGWSHTKPKGMDEMGTSLLNDFWNPLESKDGFSVALGVRYDIADSGLKLGAEFNHGSKNWLAFAPGHDDMYSSKMATRGNVYEVYGIYDLPSGEAISKYGKAWMRLGFQHYDYDYTYSGMWLGTPNKIGDIKNDPLAAQFYAPIESMNQVYLTFEASF